MVSPELRPRASRIVLAVNPLESRSQGGQAPRVVPSCHIGVRLLDLAAPLGFSLLITAGFAASLDLYTSLTPSSPHVISACEEVFFWSLAPFSCGTSSRLLDHRPDELCANGAD